MGKNCCEKKCNRGPRGHRGHRGHHGCRGATGAQGIGSQGTPGVTGPSGAQGALGPQGPGVGAQGSQGSQGPQGVGSQGPQGLGFQGPQGPPGGGGQGATGPQGPAGAQGAQGPQGPGIVDFADFFAIMPGDNSATIAPGAPVNFPQTEALGTSTIVRAPGPSPNTFLLTTGGVYNVTFQVSVDEAGQLVVATNPTYPTGIFGELPHTVVGRATGTSQIVGFSYIVATAGTALQVWNASGNATALTITPVAGGTHPVSAHLVITQVRAT